MEAVRIYQRTLLKGLKAMKEFRGSCLLDENVCAAKPEAYLFQQDSGYWRIWSQVIKANDQVEMLNSNKQQKAKFKGQSEAKR